MRAKENYSKLRSFLSAFPAYVETKKDLLKLRDKKLLAQYYIYRSYFHIDRRLKPSNVIRELRRFKYDNIYFKSEELGIDLTKHQDFNDKDLYTSSSKIIAKVTKAMLNHDVRLNSISTEYRSIDVRYKVTQTKKVVVFDTQNNHNIQFIEDLPPQYMINIAHAKGGYTSAYNKHALDFIYDYHNQSNDFAQNLEPMIEDINLFIYNR